MMAQPGTMFFTFSFTDVHSPIFDELLRKYPAVGWAAVRVAD